MPISRSNSKLAPNAAMPPTLSDPLSHRPALGLSRKSILPKFRAPITLFQPTPTGCSISTNSRRTKRIPAPSVPNNHLCPSAAKKSMGVFRTLRGSTPSPWIASTKKKTPRSLQRAPTASRSLRSPLANSAKLKLTRRVRLSMAERRSSIQMRPSRLGMARNSTPRDARFIHG